MPLQFQSLLFKKESVEDYKENNLIEELPIKYDNLGRAHLPTPYSGPVAVKASAQKFNSTNISTHVTDLHPLLKNNIEKNGKSGFMILSDGVPNFNPSSVLNNLYFYHLFKKLDLDLFSVFTYAARYSAFNPIEHVWSVLSNNLSGVSI